MAFAVRSKLYPAQVFEVLVKGSGFYFGAKTFESAQVYDWDGTGEPYGNDDVIDVIVPSTAGPPTSSLIATAGDKYPPHPIRFEKGLFLGGDPGIVFYILGDVLPE